MQDFVNLLMLLCASIGALAFGVLSAQGLCRLAFSALRMHARSIAQEDAVKAKASAATA